MRGNKKYRRYADRGKTLGFHGEGDAVLSVDLSVVSQVCENLIANAARYARTTVTITCGVRDSFLCVTVADDGPGFTPEALKNGTEPFFRDEKNDAHFGIGLYVCRLLCEKHGGSLSVGNDGGGKVAAVFGPVGF